MLSDHASIFSSYLRRQDYYLNFGRGSSRQNRKNRECPSLEGISTVRTFIRSSHLQDYLSIYLFIHLYSCLRVTNGLCAIYTTTDLTRPIRSDADRRNGRRKLMGFTLKIFFMEWENHHSIFLFGTVVATMIQVCLVRARALLASYNMNRIGSDGFNGTSAPIALSSKQARIGQPSSFE